MPLPITTEINARLAAHSQPHDPVHLLAIRNAAVVFTPRGLLSVAEKVGSCDVVMMAEFRAAKAAELGLRPVRASVIQRIGFFVVDPGDLEILVEVIPGPGFVGIQLGSLRNAGFDEARRVALALENCRNQVAAALANDDDAFRIRKRRLGIYQAERSFLDLPASGSCAKIPAYWRQRLRKL
jgi:hypothetical protein